MASYTTRLSEGTPASNPTLDSLNRSNTVPGYKYIATETGYQLVNDQGQFYNARFNDPTYQAKQRIQDLPLGGRLLNDPDALFNTVTPSVISNTNVLDKYIAENKKSLEDYAKKGQYVDPSGNLRNSDGSFVNTPEGAGTFATPGKDYGLGGGQYYDNSGTKQTMAGATQYTDKFGTLRNPDGTPDVVDEIRKLDEEAKRVNAEFERTKGQLDPTTKALVDSIHQQYENYRGTVSNIEQKRGQIARASVGSARYTPGTFADSLSNISLEGLSKIQELDSEENTLIAEARIASDENRQKDLNTILKDIKTKRDEKVATATKVSADLTKMNEEIRKEQVKAQETERKEMLGIYSNAINAGADVEMRAKLRNAQSQEEMLDIAAPVLGQKTDLDDMYKKAQIAKIYADMSESVNGAGSISVGGKDFNLPDGTDPSLFIAYAQQYAADGRIPTGLPKGTFGLVANLAKELPKPEGSVVDRNTGVKSSTVNATVQDDFSRLYNIVKFSEQLGKLDEERNGGLIAGTLGKIFGSDAQNSYITQRKAIVDEIQRMQSGAALTETEQEFYKDYLPGRFSEPFALGVDSSKKIKEFRRIMEEKLKNNLATQGLILYGFSKIKTPDGNEYKVGDVIEGANGVKARINQDGTLSPLQ